MSSSKLYPYEWFIVLLFVGTITLISLYSWVNSERESKKEYGDSVWLESSLITIKIDGAVRFPGDYQVRRGSKLEEVLSQASPLEEADLSQLKKKKITRSRQKFHVPTKKKRLRNIGSV